MESNGPGPITECERELNRALEQLGWFEKLRELLPESLKPFPLDCALRNYIQDLEKTVEHLKTQVDPLTEVGIKLTAERDRLLEELKQRCYASGGCVPLIDRDKKLAEKDKEIERLKARLPENDEPQVYSALGTLK